MSASSDAHAQDTRSISFLSAGEKEGKIWQQIFGVSKVTWLTSHWMHPKSVVKVAPFLKPYWLVRIFSPKQVTNLTHDFVLCLRNPGAWGTANLSVKTRLACSVTRSPVTSSSFARKTLKPRSWPLTWLNVHLLANMATPRHSIPSPGDALRKRQTSADKPSGRLDQIQP